MSTLASWTVYLEAPLILSGYALVIILSVLVLVRRLTSRECQLPPGPTGLPFLGYLPFLGKQAHKKLHSLSETYGPIFSLYLGRRLVVVLNTFEVVKEALSNPIILDRPLHPPNHLMPDSTSLSVSNGAVWKEQRNFAVQVLRKLGMGKEAVEERIQAEILLLEHKIDSQNGEPMNLARLLLPSVSNVVLSFLTANEERSEERRTLLDASLQIMTLYFRPTRIHAYFPSLRRWMARWKIWGYGDVEKTMKDLSQFLQYEIDYHKKTLDPECIRDYIDAFLVAQKEDKDSTYTDFMLRGNIQSLLGAGSTPARAALEWCLVSVAIYPQVQKRVHQELLGALVTKRPTWADRHHTPYSMAVIMEAMRHYTVIPISMLRTNSQSCQIGDFDIPCDTIIMTNIWSVHHDPKHWEKPNEFWPHHFLRDGKLFKPPAFIPFSFGKRNCPGEDLAMEEVYLYFVSLVQRYEILPAEGSRGFRTLLGIANMAVPDNMQLVRRNESIWMDDEH